jgi:large subunit ribosomal protein L20
MRVKGGVVSRRRHKRMLQLAEGYRGRRGNCFKQAKRGVQKGLQYAYRDRKSKKREYRTLWIARLNAAARMCGTTYSLLIQALSKANIAINRKMLSEIAIADPAAFSAITQKALKAA